MTVKGVAVSHTALSWGRCNKPKSLYATNTTIVILATLKALSVVFIMEADMEADHRQVTTVSTGIMEADHRQVTTVSTGIMEADHRQVTTVSTVRPSFHHRPSTNRVQYCIMKRCHSWRTCSNTSPRRWVNVQSHLTSSLGERAVTPHLVVRRRW